MDNAKSFERRLARLLEITGAGSDSALARILGIKAPSVAAARKRGQMPVGWIEKIAEEFGANANWLLFGEGPRLVAEVFARPALPQESGPPYRELPVLGFASCGMNRGWYRVDRMALTLPSPMPNASAGSFAIAALGYSMAPAGIKPNFVLYCDPEVRAEVGEFIYIERRDGQAAVKILRERTDEWLTIEGWLDPDEDGMQKLYREKVRISSLARQACVIFIRLKA